MNKPNALAKSHEIGAKCQSRCYSRSNYSRRQAQKAAVHFYTMFKSPLLALIRSQESKKWIIKTGNVAHFFEVSNEVELKAVAHNEKHVANFITVFS